MKWEMREGGSGGGYHLVAVGVMFPVGFKCLDPFCLARRAYLWGTRIERRSGLLEKGDLDDCNGRSGIPALHEFEC